MRLLLDTHALIWWTGAPDKLKPVAREAIAGADHVAVSAACLWEVAVKTAAGKLRPPDGLVDELADMGLEPLAVTAGHVWHTRTLPLHHGDPVDRLLVAQAQLEGFTVVTRDPHIPRYAVSVLPA
ncbi:MAG: type II toxin-antitoxin system VapC family toxin [Gaiella sp.]